MFAVAALAFAASALAQLSLAARGVPELIDDSFYYLLIARHFAESGAITFDGVNPTNGFHPLWMVLLAGMYCVVGPGASLMAQLVGAKSLELAVLAAAVASCLHAFARTRSRTPLAWGFAAMAVVLLVPGWGFFREGMETTLAALALAWVLLAMVEDDAPVLAIALPVLFLSRLDTLVFVIAPIAAAWLMRHDRASWKPFVPLALVALAYFGGNLIATGSATPISGQLKSSFPLITPHWSFLRDPIDALPWAGWRGLVLAPSLLQVSVVVAIAAVASLAFRRRPWWGTVMLALAIAALLILNQLLFQRWDKGVDTRYLAMPWLLAAFAAGTMLAAASERTASIAVMALLAACAIASLVGWHARRDERIDRTTHFQVMALAKPGERFAGTDVGAFAFWLERPFVNLDGLVNNRHLQAAIRDRRFAQYLRDQDVRFLALAFWDAPQAHVSRPVERMYRSRIAPEVVAGPRYPHYDFTVYSYLFGVDSDPVRLCPSQEVFRADIGRDGTANAAIVIYKLALPCRS